MSKGLVDLRWRKKERQLVYEREQVNNALMDTNVLKSKLEKEVVAKNTRI